jgi:hypothetical protein
VRECRARGPLEGEFSSEHLVWNVVRKGKERAAGAGGIYDYFESTYISYVTPE